MSQNENETNGIDKDQNMTSILSIYEQVNEIQRYEGAGIWSRFNILISLNIVLFGAVTFILNSKLPNGLTLVRILSISGCLMSFWSVYVLQRLWLWHVHWKNTLQQIEALFPENLPKPFSNRPTQLQKSSSWFQNWLLAYTQPFMFIFFAIWLIIAILSINGSIYSVKTKKNTVIQTQQIEKATVKKKSPPVPPIEKLSIKKTQ